ncbi:hydrolase-like protein [Trypanosoma rangeli]|uniref:Hydrolase-like protein n=1 Tax=Trypanosoma rangeli TaxID=5698 RepID=A0A3S5IRR1_TRYRA|nr:hydrolase-like protein [Trypanosoma rangeli]RNF08286.1 hydrolase-like protein [Trypanosoma rangeli]|eukprot:RNF08286.1 hydrolase-like protein [Trypanosoma rangeli]
MQEEMMLNNTSTVLSHDRYSRFGESFADVGVCRSTGIRIQLCYQTFGRRDAVGGVVLLIMGIASPLLLWDTKFCECLASRGYYVIRFDNRDTGRSTFLTGRRVLPAKLSTTFVEDEMEVWDTHYDAASSQCGLGSLVDSALLYPRLAFASLVPGRHNLLRGVYTLEDMARDSVGLLDALHISKTHIVGMCMGGMIAQVMAVYHPTRVESLSLISTHSGSPQARWPALREALALASFITYATRKGFAVPLSLRGKNGRSMPSPKEIEELAHALVNLIERFASGSGASFPIDRAACLIQMRRMLRRSSDFSGALRQYVALLNAQDRLEGLRHVCVPTVILHGTADPIVPYFNGEELAALIPHAKLVSVTGLGHVLHPALRGRIVDALTTNMRQSRRGEQDPVTASKL